MTKNSKSNPFSITPTALMSGLEWYWGRKSNAYCAINSLNSGHYATESRDAYADFFINLLSAIDLVTEFDENFKVDIISMFEVEGLAGKDSWEYTRLLRHVAVHRGGDLGESGIGVQGVQIPLCPKKISGRMGTFARYTPLMFAMVIFLEAAVGKTIDSFLDRKGLWAPAYWEEEFAKQTSADIDSYEHMPNYVKTVLIANMETIQKEHRPWVDRHLKLRKSLQGQPYRQGELQQMFIEAEDCWKDSLQRLGVDIRPA